MDCRRVMHNRVGWVKTDRRVHIPIRSTACFGGEIPILSAAKDTASRLHLAVLGINPK